MKKPQTEVEKNEVQKEEVEKKAFFFSREDRTIMAESLEAAQGILAAERKAAEEAAK